MKYFKDTLDRTWTIDLTVGCLRRVKAQVNVDLIAPEATVDELGRPDATQRLTLAQRLTSDVMLFVDILYACLKVKADELALTVEQFCESIPPAICRDARNAFLQEWEDFFRSLDRNDQAAVIRAAIDLVNEQRQLTDEATRKLVVAAMPQMRAEVDKALDEAMLQLSATSGTWSTSSPASSESTPNH